MGLAGATKLTWPDIRLNLLLLKGQRYVISIQMQVLSEFKFKVQPKAITLSVLLGCFAEIIGTINLDSLLLALSISIRTPDPLVKVNSTLSLTASTLLHSLVLLSVCFIYLMSGRQSTNWDRQG